MWAVVPVKRFSNAKTRLAPLLSEAERESLAQAMLNDVLRALSAARLVSGLIVVSHEVRARYAAERAGGLFVEEDGSGLSTAIAQGASFLAEHGQRGLVMIPGDVPLVSANEIDRIIGQHAGEPAVTLAPDRERDGTNALALTPTDAIPFRFGRGSFGAHCAACRAAAIEPRVENLAGLGLDIDNPIDLQTLLTYDMETETLDYLCDSGIARRLGTSYDDGADRSGRAAAYRLL